MRALTLVACGLIATSAGLLLTGCNPSSNDQNIAQKPASQEIAVADRTPLDPTQDPFQWLEDVEGEQALAWVREKNQSTLSRLESDERFQPLMDKLLTRYNATDKIAYGSFDVGGIHNFWQDANHVRGLWRRADYDSYVSGKPVWETLLDFDALAEAENENWVYKGRTCLRGSTRCLLRLSRGGSDASVIREFDVATKTFVEGGFVSPEAKQWFAWVNQDSLLIATDFGPDTLNSSGYPTQVKLWQRGTPLSDATLVLEGKDAVFNFPGSSHRDDGHHVFVIQRPDFFTQRLFLLNEEMVPQRVNLPEGINFQGFYKNHLVVQLRKDWHTAKAGEVALIPVEKAFSDTLNPADATHIISPDGKASIEKIAIGANGVYYTVLRDVVSELHRYEYASQQSQPHLSTLLPLPDNGAIGIYSVDTSSERAFVQYASMLSPSAFFSIEQTGIKKVAQLPQRFTSEGLVTEQFFATSKDGTQVPYFVVRPSNAPMDGSTPTILYGYGGFEISLTPNYLSGLAGLWVEQGGAYVVANIRGGGEYGPEWHQAALKANRQRAYDDFIAVAEDLVARKLTSPQHLGIRGGSNGGLLMGVMTTQRPDLFNAVICAVPLLDMYRYHQLLAGASWIGEYGDPSTDDWSFIREYSPYHNVFDDVRYPEVFFYTSTKDDRVHPGHARKMAARMLAQGHPVLYYENIEGGHSAAANLKQSAYTDALQLVYSMQKLVDAAK